MAEGRSNAAIAAELVVSDGAVEKHVTNIFTKLDLLPADQFETRRLPARPVRGFGLVEPLTVRRH